MPYREWRKFAITGGWWRVEWRSVYPDHVGNWVKIAHVAHEKLADTIVEMGELGQI